MNSLRGPTELYTVAARRPRRQARDAPQRREGGGGPLRQAGALLLQRRQGRHGLRLRRLPGGLRPGEEVPGGFPDPRRAAGQLRQRLPLPVEPAGIRGRGIRGGDGGLPRLHGLRPGVHRRHQQRLGRRPVRRPHEGAGLRSRQVPVHGQGAGRGARRLLRRLHDQLDRRADRPLQVPGLPRRQPRRAHGLLRHRGAVVPGVGPPRHCRGSTPRTTRSRTPSSSSRTGRPRCSWFTG